MRKVEICHTREGYVVKFFLSDSLIHQYLVPFTEGHQFPIGELPKIRNYIS